MVSSLTELASGAALSQNNIRSTGSKLASSIASLASGNRITQALQDIASLSAATSLQSQVTGLRSAALNVAQAGSFLQVADGGLNQIGGILDRMQALSVQANSGALSESARAGINAEFQGLADEINRISGNTNFNDVNLIDGSLSNGGALQSSTSQGTKATGSLDFTANIGAGQTIEINGTTLTEGVDFNAGGTIQATLDSLTNTLNNSSDPNLSEATFERVGNSVRITADAAGEAGNQFTIDQGASTAAASFTVGGDALTGAGVFSLTGGTDAGLSAGDTSFSGSVNDSLVSSQAGQAASTTINFSDVSDIQAGDTISIDDGEGGLVNFTFVSGTPATNTEIQIGSDVESTLENAVDTFENFSGPGDFGVRQLDFNINGNSLEISNSVEGDALDVAGNPLDIALGTTGGTISNTQLDNGTTSGIDVTGVTNADFLGEIQGFKATFNGADDVTVSLQVGGDTFTGRVSDTTPAGDTTVRFQSENGGFFDVTLSGGNGQAVTNQADADTFANRLDAAFSGLEFSQNRDVSSFNGSGQLYDASFEFQASGFENITVEDVRVNSGVGGTASIEIDINGQTFRSEAGLGESIGVGESIRLANVNNPNEVLTFNNGSNAINLNSQSGADTLQNGISQGFGVGTGGSGVSFQVGNGSEDTVNFAIGDFSAGALFNGQNLDLLSSGNAATAQDVIASAINSLTAGRAEIGALQQGFSFAAANLETAILNQEAARAALSDTDIASESTQNALLQVQQQQSIATLAQTNRLLPNILDLLGN